MATDTLTAVPGSANSNASLDQLAATIQIQASRIDSLASAIDDALDLSNDIEANRAALDRALDFVHLIREAAEKARAAGEELEIYELNARKAARQ